MCFLHGHAVIALFEDQVTIAETLQPWRRSRENALSRRWWARLEELRAEYAGGVHVPNESLG